MYDLPNCRAYTPDRKHGRDCNDESDWLIPGDFDFDPLRVKLGPNAFLFDKKN